MQIEVKIDTSRFEARMADLIREQLPFATAKALTDTAKDAERSGRTAMKQIFDRPTPYTLNSLYTQPATKRRLVAKVLFKSDAGKGTPATKYLGPQAYGGPRRQTGAERALQRAGILPDGYFVVPSKFAPLDSYGNIPARVYVQVLSDLRAFTDVGAKQNRITKREVATRNAFYRAQGSRKRARAKESRFFAVQPGKRGQPGIYRKIDSGFGRGAVPLLIFVKQPQYSKRLDLDAIVKREVDRSFGYNFDRALSLALSTAR